jgi:hypothetical protein
MINLLKNPELIHTVCEKRANSNEGLVLKQIILSKLSTKVLKTHESQVMPVFPQLIHKLLTGLSTGLACKSL